MVRAQAKYDLIALRAVELFKTGKFDTIVASYDSAAQESYPNKQKAREKSCPRSGFLALCEEGMITSVPKGKYNPRLKNKNKQYMINALRLLIQNPELN